MKAYCWENRDLAEQGRTELTNLGGKRMNSTKLHSLSLSCGTQAGETTLGGFGLQRWRARRRIKEGKKLGGDFSKAGAADRESNVEHMQAAASSNERGDWQGLRAWRQREKKKKEKETAAGPED